MSGVFEHDWHGALNGRDFWQAWKGLRVENVEGVVQNAGAVTGKTSHPPHRTFFSYCRTIAHVSPLEESLTGKFKHRSS